MPAIGTRSLLIKAIREAKPGREQIRLLELLGEYEGWLNRSKPIAKPNAIKSSLSALAESVGS
jgi:hypothetical protein